MCIIHVLATHELHLYFYICNTCVGYTSIVHMQTTHVIHVLHVWNMYCGCLLMSRDSIRWLYSRDKSSYISSVYSQCHVVILKCTEQNVNNQTLTQVSQLYVHVYICLTAIRSWLNLPTGGHGHVICMVAFIISVWIICVTHQNTTCHIVAGVECDKLLRSIQSHAVNGLIWNGFQNIVEM